MKKINIFIAKSDNELSNDLIERLENYMDNFDHNINLHNGQVKEDDFIIMLVSNDYLNDDKTVEQIKLYEDNNYDILPLKIECLDIDFKDHPLTKYKNYLDSILDNYILNNNNYYTEMSDYEKDSYIINIFQTISSMCNFYPNRYLTSY